MTIPWVHTDSSCYMSSSDLGLPQVMNIVSVWPQPVYEYTYFMIKNIYDHPWFLSKLIYNKYILRTLKSQPYLMYALFNLLTTKSMMTLHLCQLLIHCHPQYMTTTSYGHAKFMTTSI